MKSIRIVHTADLHIGGRQNGEGRMTLPAAERLAVFGRILALARGECADLLLIAGDLFDIPCPDGDAVETVRAQLAEAGAAGLHTFLVAGNHDPLTPGSPYLEALCGLPGLHIFGGEPSEVTVRIRDCTVAVGGRSMCAPYTDVSPLADFPPQNPAADLRILLLHGDLGVPGSRYAPLTARELAAVGADYAALGHIHKRTEVLREGMTFYAYSGCPQGGGFDETGPMGVYAGELRRGAADLHFCPVARRQYLIRNIDVSDLTAPSRAAEYILSALRAAEGEGCTEHAWRLILRGTCRFALQTELLRTQLADTLWRVQLRDETLPPPEGGEDAVGLRGEFFRRMRKRMDACRENSEELALCENALRIGLRALEGEVKHDDL